MDVTLPFPTEYPREQSYVLFLLTNPKGQAIFAIIAFSAIILFNSFFYLFHPYDGMGLYHEASFEEIYVIYSGGPAEEAGVKVGDQVVSIDGRHLDPQRSEPRYRLDVVLQDIVERSEPY